MLVLDLSLPAGDAGRWTGTIYGPTGAVQDLTGLTITFTLASPTPVSKTLTLTGAASTGGVQLALVRADTQAVPAGAYDYDVVLTDVGGSRTTAAKGKFYVVGHPNP